MPERKSGCRDLKQGAGAKRFTLGLVASDVRMLDGRGPDAEDDAPATHTDVPSREPVAVGELPF